MFTSPTRSVTALAGVTLLAASLIACAPVTEEVVESSSTKAPKTVRVVVHDSFQMSDEQKAEFTKTSGYDVEIVTNGDGGALVNKLILTKDAPLGDVTFGVDNTFASRGTDEGVFAPYTSKNESKLGASLRLAGDNTLNPVDYGDVCLNIDPQWFEKNNIAEPKTLDDLIKPEYKDLTVVTNPATSSPGLSFLFATIGAYGEAEYLNYWDALKNNGLKIVDGWEDAYYVDFTAVEKGDRPIVLSYASSPAFTVTEDKKDTTTKALLDTCFRQVEYAGVLTNAANPQGAQAFIDYLLSDSFQGTIPDAMYMYPASDSAELPDDWAKFAPVPENPISLDPSDIATNRDAWLKEWSAQIIG
ncbi:thiamine ABC transporter substrate-binding protein [Timonella sp. A28]|uniref:thiamine ABC transporter substrate-binding protein n=1 Tax=Timonella sp. A28 TaxID=3442640 RepID=UPI003EBB02CE